MNRKGKTLMTPKVFVVEEPRIRMDISCAEQFGQIEYIVDKDFRGNPFNDLSEYAENIIKKLQSKRFDPALDYFCIVGAQIAVSIALAMALDEWGEIKILMFNASDSKYVPATLSSRYELAEKIDNG